MLSKFSIYQRKIRGLLSKNKQTFLKFMVIIFMFIHLFSCVNVFAAKNHNIH